MHVEHIANYVMQKEKTSDFYKKQNEENEIVKNLILYDQFSDPAYHLEIEKKLCANHEILQVLFD